MGDPENFKGPPVFLKFTCMFQPPDKQILGLGKADKQILGEHERCRVSHAPEIWRAIWSLLFKGNQTLDDAPPSPLCVGNKFSGWKRE